MHSGRLAHVHNLGPRFSQSIKPPPSPAVVSSLLDSLGLDKGVVHADDLLLALLVICGMVPGDKVPEVWGAPPKYWRDYYDACMHPGVCLWGPCRGQNYFESGDYCLEWDGPPTRMTWANDSASS
ncbi:hypothetical protein T492DRAFT_840168 [Pavlovales sp. CCMP2436]|nr:hypothetical protein T492DRAFT_840168 [Pavlovales sp. CCMP2436]